MSYSDVREQEVAKRLIRNITGSGRLAHAYLFVGPPDTGKVALALNMAKAVNCESGGSDPCDSCRQCVLTDRGVHPDVHVLRPRKASRTISIDRVRELQREISLKPLTGEYRIALIIEADRMKPDAANSLLKTLEEPPPGTIFILTCEDTSGLLPTVLSRCQRINFMPVSRKAVKEVLAAEAGVSPSLAEVISHLAEGSVKTARAYCKPPEMEWRKRLLDGISRPADVQAVFEEAAMLDDHFNEYQKEAAASLRGGPADMNTDEAAAMAKGLLLQEISRTLAVYLSWFRDVLMAKVTDGDDIFTNVDRVEEIRRAAGRTSSREIIRKIEKIDDTASMIYGNINRKTALDVLLLDLHRAGEGVPCPE